jgi:uncharacterized membrane protein YhaH (DUF805 family)
MSDVARVNRSFINPGGVVGRADFARNTLKALGLVAATAVYAAGVDGSGVLQDPEKASLFRLCFDLLVLVPIPLALGLAFYGLVINTFKRVRDLRGPRAIPIVWMVLLLIPIVSFVIRLFLFTQPGGSGRNT